MLNRKIAKSSLKINHAPDFLQKRLATYYQGRLAKWNEWNGGPILNGKVPGENAIMLVSNDYLSIANDSRICQAIANTALRQGNGMLMSAVFQSGETPERKFEKTLARFVGMEDGMLSQSGYCANVGLIQSIANKEVPIYYDKFIHMSLREGVKSAGAKGFGFRHNDVNHLQQLIRENGQGIILVESVYSTSGNISPLADFAEVAISNNCIFVVDESHSLGTHGVNGEGMASDLGLLDAIDFITASLAKAFSGRGGIILGSTYHMDFLRYESLPLIFSSAVLPHDVAGFEASLEIIKTEPWRRKRLFENADRLRNGLRNIGYNVEDSQSQIVSLESGTEQQTIILRNALEARNIFGSLFCAPATSLNHALIRFSVNASLTDTQIDKIISVCEEIKDEVNYLEWPSTKRLYEKKI